MDASLAGVSVVSLLSPLERGSLQYDLHWTTRQLVSHTQVGAREL